MLQIGKKLAVPIPDLALDDDGVRCTLSFDRRPFFCVVPWESVFAMVGDDGRWMVWPDDVSPEVRRQVQSRKDNEATSGPSRDPAQDSLAALEPRHSLHLEESHTLNCSFCGKWRKEVASLVAGPGVYICDECIDLSMDILDESDEGDRKQKAGAPSGQPPERADPETFNAALHGAVSAGALNLVQRANELHDVVVDLEDTWRRHQRDLREELTRVRSMDRRSVEASERGEIPQPYAKVQRLSELASDCASRRNQAYREWEQAKERAVAFLCSEVGLKATAPQAPEEEPVETGLRCTFCDKAQSRVARLIAGPTVYICDECIRRCDRVRRRGGTSLS